jgi:hypothetical protein
LASAFATTLLPRSSGGDPSRRSAKFWLTLQSDAKLQMKKIEIARLEAAARGQ